MSKKQAIIWGAGKIGRGFLGEIFQDAGYHLTFVEYDMRLVEALRQAGYDGTATIELVSMYTDDPTYYARCAIERTRELL